VGSSTFKFGFQGGNPYYKKIQVANARVPIESVQIKRNGAWQQLVKTIGEGRQLCKGGELGRRARRDIGLCALLQADTPNSLAGDSNTIVTAAARAHNRLE
jgi:hypothetical protein